MNKPDPDEFARKMLWHISGLRAEVRHLRAMQARQMAAQVGMDENVVMKKWKADSDASQKKIYLEAIREVGLEPHKKSGEQGGK